MNDGSDDGRRMARALWSPKFWDRPVAALRGGAYRGFWSGHRSKG